MGVYVKGMKIPPNCFECGDIGNDCVRCHLWESFEEWMRSRHPDCPLDEIPEPHGRLIDAEVELSDEKGD